MPVTVLPKGLTKAGVKTFVDTAHREIGEQFPKSVAPAVTKVKDKKVQQLPEGVDPQAYIDGMGENGKK